MRALWRTLGVGAIGGFFGAPLAACLTINVSPTAGAAGDASTLEAEATLPDGGSSGGAGNDGAQGVDARASSPPTGPAQDLATGQQTPKSIVVDATHVYWLNEASGGNGGAIMTVAKVPDAGAPAIITNGLRGPYAMVGDATTLYWSDPADTGLYKHDKGGGNSVNLSVSEVPFGLTLSGGIVFFAASPNNGEVLSVNIDGTSRAWLSTNLGTDVKVVAVDATDVYAGKTGQILKFSKGGGSPIIFANTSGPVQAIAADAQNVYWLDSSNVRALDKSMVSGTPTNLATAQNAPSAMALDDANVYWTNAGDGQVQTVPKAGGSPTPLSTGEASPGAIAVDGAGVYWTNHGDGRVRVIWR